MGKTTGFLEYERELPQKQSVEERLKHYGEFVFRFSDEQLNRQAARCMNCGIPFCHHSCPLGNIIPEFNDAVYRKDLKKAYEILIATNNFPEFTGRICPAPCESACVLGINQPAVTIEEIERHIIEIAFENGLVQPKKPLVRTGKKVAVVGSGPAGLAAAAQLNYAGHQVTVFERDDAPGGLLRYGIPDFKLEKRIVDRRIKLMEEEGVEFRCHAYVGVNVSVQDILREYHAIVLAGGCTVPRDLPVPGRELKGIYFAMQYLKQQNKRVAGKEALQYGETESNPAAEQIVAGGKHVVVIGGGDTGSDCIGTANRQGALSVTQLELLPRPPESRTPHMPWPTYPMILKTSTSHEEGAVRIWSVNTKAFLGDERGKLRALLLADVKWEYGADGKPLRFSEIPGTEREIRCDLALLAMGFVHPLHEGMIEALGLELDARKNVKADEKSFQTHIPKVFACGDMRRGQSLVVWAIAEGRACAAAVDAYLKERTGMLAGKSAERVQYA
ncbi:MAG: glutamate synthase subunit beta [Chitinophagaceae bacterium]|nr:glutamate synthase subunit beta [Chitinophagaceae bacterium]